MGPPRVLAICLYHGCEKEILKGILQSKDNAHPSPIGRWFISREKIHSIGNEHFGVSEWRGLFQLR